MVFDYSHNSNGGRSLFFTFFGIFKLLLLFLLLFALVRRTYFYHSEPMYFTSFLQMLHDVPVFDVSGIRAVSDYTNSLADIPIIGGSIAFLGGILTVVQYGCIGILQLLRYVIYFIGYLFV